jgi:hypothetical protein
MTSVVVVVNIIVRVVDSSIGRTENGVDLPVQRLTQR